MGDKTIILYFLEDRAQEGFIKALVEQIAKEESFLPGSFTHEIRSARGGSRIITEFKSFLKTYQKMDAPGVDFLVVAIDGNCKGYNERKKELEKHLKPGHPFKDRAVFAIPDPHIERWYILDQKAFKEGVGIEKAPALPAYKCKKDYYKQLLIQTLKEADINALFGGAEYAEKIVESIKNIDAVDKHNAGFLNFVRDLRRMLKTKGK